MYGDTFVIRHLAKQLDDQATAIRLHSQQLVARATEVAWAGRAAESMRTSMQEQAADLHRTAELHEAAAGALRAHAGQVEAMKEAIAQIANEVHALVAGALGRLADLASQALDVVTHANPGDLRLRDLSLPPPGHADWLRMPELLPEIQAPTLNWPGVKL